MVEFMKCIKNTISKYGMVTEGDLLLVAVSGGPDSLTLLHVLNKCKEELGIRLHVVHLDHSFRGKEAEDEAEWVGNTARDWGIPYTLGKADVPALARSLGMSSQEAGHLARKRFFMQMAQELGASKIALGHHADDQAETLIMHFFKGAGMEGLRGMVPVHGPYIRPLLNVNRDGIEAYCRNEGLSPRQDPSNKKNVYLRNKIRNTLMPWLKESINPNLAETLNRTAKIFWAEEEYLEEKTREAAAEILVKGESVIRIKLASFNTMPLALQRRLIRHAYGMIADIQGISYLHVEDIRELSRGGQVGKVLHLPNKMIVEKAYNTLDFYRSSHVREAMPISKKMINIPGTTLIPEIGWTIKARLSKEKPTKNTPFAIYVPCVKTLPTLFARTRQEGDRISPKGLNGSKKLKDFFIDKKIPRNERDRTLLIAEESEVIWIPGVAFSNKIVKNEDFSEYIVLWVEEFSEDVLKECPLN